MAGGAPSSPCRRRRGPIGPNFTASRRPRRMSTERHSRCGGCDGWTRLQPTLNMWPTCPWRRGAERRAESGTAHRSPSGTSGKSHGPATPRSATCQTSLADPCPSQMRQPDWIASVRQGKPVDQFIQTMMVGVRVATEQDYSVTNTNPAI